MGFVPQVRADSLILDPSVSMTSSSRPYCSPQDGLRTPRVSPTVLPFLPSTNSTLPSFPPLLRPFHPFLPPFPFGLHSLSLPEELKDGPSAVSVTSTERGWRGRRAPGAGTHLRRQQHARH